MIVRLKGDGSSYVGMLQHAQGATAAAMLRIRASAAGVEHATAAVGGFGFGMRRFALSAMGALAPMAGAIGTLGSAFSAVRLAADAESAAVTFEVLLGSAEAAQERFDELARFAAATPFNLPEILQASKLLQTFGGSSLAVGKPLTMVGDMASAAGVGFAEVAMWVGRAYTAIQSGRPFGEAGMRLQELGLLGGVERSEMERLQKTGASSAVQWANFERVMSKFTGTMVKQSVTTHGLFSTMKDDIDGLLRVIGKDIINIFMLKEGMMAVSQAAQGLTEWFKGLSPEMKRLAVGFLVGVTALSMFTLAWPMLAFVAKAAMANLFSVLDLILGPVNLIGAAVLGLGLVWVRSVGGMGNALGIVKAKLAEAWEWMVPLREVAVFLFDFGRMLMANSGEIADAIMGGVGQAFGWLRGVVLDAAMAVGDFVAANRTTFVSLGVMAGAVLLGYVAFKLLWGVMALLHVQSLVGYAIWLGLSAVLWALSITIGAVKVVTWLWNAAMTVGAGLLGAVATAALAVIGIFAGVVGIGLAVAAVAVGIWNAVNEVVNVFSALPAAATPLAHITGLFGEWWSWIKMISNAMTTDMGLAWQMTKIGFQILVMQLKDLWDPLWVYIKTGFGAVWEVVKAQTVKAFWEMVTGMTEALLNFLTEGPMRLLAPVMALAAGGMRRTITQTLDRQIVEATAQANIANRGLTAALGSFGAVAESAGIQDLRDELTGLNAEVLGADVAVAPTVTPRATTMAGQAGQALGAAVNQGMEKEIHKLDFALRYSAEAIARINEYKARFDSVQAAGSLPGSTSLVRPGIAAPSAPGVVPGIPAVVPPGQPAAAGGGAGRPAVVDERIVTLLGETNTILRQIAAQPNLLRAIGLTA